MLKDCFFHFLFLGSNHTSNLNVPSNSRHFAQVQASGYSPALQRKKNSILSNSGRLLGWMTEPAAPSAATGFKNRDSTATHAATFQHNRQPSNAPPSILVRPDSHKNNIDKVMSCWGFLLRDTSSKSFACYTSAISVITVLHVPHKKSFPPLASKVSAVPHRWRLPSSKTSDLLVVVRKSGSLQRPPSAGSVGPIAHPGKGWTGNRSQRRKSFSSQERPWNSHLRFKF